MAGKKIFLDTNILVHANNAASPYCVAARAKLTDLATDYESYWISRQVIREYLAVMTNLMKLAGKIDHTLMVTDVQNFLDACEVAEETDDTTQHLLRLLVETSAVGKFIHDCNIVAIMLTQGIDTICTQNVGDFGRFSHLINIKAL